MSQKDIYLFLRSKGLIKTEHPEYEIQPEELKHQEYLNWKNSLPLEEVKQYNYVFGE